MTERQLLALRAVSRGALQWRLRIVRERDFIEYFSGPHVLTSQIKALRRLGLIRFKRRGDCLIWNEDYSYRFMLTPEGEKELAKVQCAS